MAQVRQSIEYTLKGETRNFKVGDEVAITRKWNNYEVADRGIIEKFDNEKKCGLLKIQSFRGDKLENFCLNDLIYERIRLEPLQRPPPPPPPPPMSAEEQEMERQYKVERIAQDRGMTHEGPHLPPYKPPSYLVPLTEQEMERQYTVERIAQDREMGRGGRRRKSRRLKKKIRKTRKYN